MKRILFIVSLLISSHVNALPVPSAPDLKASSYHLIDYRSGDILATKNPDIKLAPASMTKIMTALIVFRELNQGNLFLEEQVRISEKAWRTPGSRMFVEVNKFVTVNELIHGMLVQSGNDATVALSEHIAGDESTFAQLMNQVANELGMKNSHFMNSSGLPDDNHYTTARDLSILTRALITESPELYKINAIKEYTFNGITQQNRNKLLWRDSTVDGVKTGHTEDAWYCLVSSAVRENMRLISVVMGTDSVEARNNANQTLLNYGYRFYKTHLLYKAEQSLTTTRVWKGAQQTVSAGLVGDLYLTVPRNKYKDLDASLEIDPQLVAPIKKHQRIGSVVIKLNNEIIATRPLVALQEIPEGSLVDILKDEVLLLLE